VDKEYLILKRASASRPSGEWDDDDFDVLADGVVIGRINSNAGPVGGRWPSAPMSTPTHGHAATREAAMAERAAGGKDRAEIDYCGSGSARTLEC
jgi:hypothetical protein